MATDALSDAVRLEAMDALLRTKTLEKCLPVWLPRIDEILGDQPSADKILGLSDHLREIFSLTAPKGRDQKALAAGGTAWEGLVMWYLNLCLVGTSAVVVKKRRDIPQSVLDALTVTYQNEPTTTESDLVAVSLPTHATESEQGGVLAVSRWHSLVEKYFDETTVAVIQCKTNWNDNAQVPMLWNIVYNADGIGTVGISVGRRNRSTRQLSKFSYCFATVPSQKKLDEFQMDSMPVLRVRSLSGGNYWGIETRDGVADSLREFFQRTKVGPTGGSGVRSSLAAAAPVIRTSYGYFFGNT